MRFLQGPSGKAVSELESQDWSHSRYVYYGTVSKFGSVEPCGLAQCAAGAVEWASLGAVGIRFSAHKAMLHRCGEFYVHAALIMWISNAGLRKDSGGGHVGTRRGAVVVHGSPYLRHYYLSQLRLIGT